MTNIVNRKLVDSHGKAIKPQTLYGFFATLHDKETGKKQGDEINTGQFVLGNSKEANEAAKQLEVMVQESHPDSRVCVHKHAMELVGPLSATQIVNLREQIQITQMVANYLAQIVAEKEAESSLEINPDLTMDQRVEYVLKNAQAFVADQIRIFYEQQQAQKSGLVGPDGNPVSVDTQVSAAAEADVQTESPEDVAEQEALAQQMREDAGVGKVLAFPGQQEAPEKIETLTEDPVLA